VTDTRRADENTAPSPAAIDWHEIHRRLAQAQAALEEESRPTPETRNAILRARAQKLAQPPGDKGAAEAALNVVVFQLGHECYGVEACYVREVYPLKEVTPLPCISPFILGLINVRGQILSVVDLKQFLELPAKEGTDPNKVILLHQEAMTLGILVDALIGVRQIFPSQLQPAPPTLTASRQKLLKGVTGEPMILLDAEKLLTHPELIIQDEVESA
jgi:purine-binding chemotaxis protein CheW